MAKDWDITGLRAGPWANIAGLPHRAALDPLPFQDPFVAAAWGFIKKGEFDKKYFWRAGRESGPAVDLDDAKAQADASLREQGVALPASCTADEPCFSEKCASCMSFFGRGNHPKS